jgi:hypothetical protein
MGNGSKVAQNSEDRFSIGNGGRGFNSQESGHSNVEGSEWRFCT